MPSIRHEPSWLTGPALKLKAHSSATQCRGSRAKGKAHCGGGSTSPVVRGTTPMEKVCAVIWETSAPPSRSDDGDWPELRTPPPPPLSATLDRCEVSPVALVRPVKLRGAKVTGACVHGMMIVFMLCHTDNAIKQRGPGLNSCRR